MTPIPVVGTGSPYYQMGAFSPIPREVLLPNIFLRLELRDLYCVSLGSRQLCDLTLSDPGFLKLCVKKYFPAACHRRSCSVQGVDYAALCKELASRKRNLREVHCTGLSLHDVPLFFDTELCFSIQENRFLAFSVEGGMLRAWDCEGQLTSEWVSFDPDELLSFQMDDEHLTVGVGDQLQTYSFEQKHFSLLPQLEKNSLIHHFYRQGDRIVTDLGNGSIKLWDGSGSFIRTLQKPQEHKSPSTTCLHMDENYIVRGLENGSVDVWSHKDLSPLKRVPMPKDIIGKADISYLLIRGDLLFVGALYGAFTIWNLKTQTRVRTLLTRENNLCLDCDLKVVDDYLIVAEGRVLKIWDLISSHDEPIQRFTFNQPICSTSMRENRLLVATTDAKIRIFDFDPSLLTDLQIVTSKQYLDKLECSASFLSVVGLCSSADLQQLGLFQERPEIENIETTHGWIELQTVQLKAYLTQRYLRSFWADRAYESIYTLSALKKRRPTTDPFKLVADDE
jgi:WD40 repeat protein